MKKAFENKKLIIFDLDGTLIESLSVWNEVDRRVIERIRTDGKPTTENTQLLRDQALRLFSKHENPYFAYYGLMKEVYGAKETVEEIHAMRYAIATELLKYQVDYKPYAVDLIKKLKKEGYALAIGSTTTTNNMNIYRKENVNLLRKAPLDDYFSYFLTRNDVKEIKPHPEVFAKIMEHFGATPTETLVIEDSLVGLECALNAGCECLIVYEPLNDCERDELNRKATYTVRDFGELI